MTHTHGGLLHTAATHCLCHCCTRNGRPQTTAPVNACRPSTPCSHNDGGAHTAHCWEAQAEQIETLKRELDNLKKAARNPHLAGVLYARAVTRASGMPRSEAELMTERWFAAFLLPLYGLTSAGGHTHVIDG